MIQVNIDNKLELYLGYDVYMNMPATLRKTIKDYFVFSGRRKAWVSKGKHDSYSVQSVVKDLEKYNAELVKGIQVEQEHKETFQKVASGEISVDQAVVETAQEHLSENEDYYKKVETAVLSNTEKIQKFVDKLNEKNQEAYAREYDIQRSKGQLMNWPDKQEYIDSIAGYFMAIPKLKYTNIDKSTTKGSKSGSAFYMIDNESLIIYDVKGYGQVNKDRNFKTVDYWLEHDFSMGTYYSKYLKEGKFDPIPEPKVENPVTDENPRVDVLEQINMIAGEYGWTAEKNGAGDYELSNRNKKMVAILNYNYPNYTIYDSNKTKLLSGNKNVYNAIKDVMVNYFYAKKIEFMRLPLKKDHYFERSLKENAGDFFKIREENGQYLVYADSKFNFYITTLNKQEFDELFNPEARAPKFNENDFVKYEGGDTFKEKWYGQIVEVEDLGNEYAYRVNAYAYNEDGGILYDNAYNNQKYEAQLSKLNDPMLFKILKDQYLSKSKPISQEAQDIIRPEWDKMQEFLNKPADTIGDTLEMAKEIGKRAFREGKKRIPAMDKNLMDFFETEIPDALNSSQLMEQWYKGWDIENLNAPVEQSIILNFKSKEQGKEFHRLMLKELGVSNFSIETLGIHPTFGYQDKYFSKDISVIETKYGEFIDSEKDSNPVASINYSDVEWLKLGKEITSSISSIISIDKGEMPGFDRTLFMSSIKGKLERLDKRGETELVDKALDLVKGLSDKHTKPLFTSKHSIWTLGSKKYADITKLSTEEAMERIRKNQEAFRNEVRPNDWEAKDEQLRNEAKVLRANKGNTLDIEVGDFIVVRYGAANEKLKVRRIERNISEWKGEKTDRSTYYVLPSNREGIPGAEIGYNANEIITFEKVGSELESKKLSNESIEKFINSREFKDNGGVEGLKKKISESQSSISNFKNKEGDFSRDIEMHNNSLNEYKQILKYLESKEELKLTIDSISNAMKGNDFWMKPDSIQAKIIQKAEKEGYVNRMSHTQVQWNEEGLGRLRDIEKSSTFVDDFSDINNDFVKNLITQFYDDVQRTSSEGSRNIIQTALSFLRRSQKSNNENKGSKNYKLKETEELKKFAIDNELIYNPFKDKSFLEKGIFLEEGAEQKVYFDGANVIKFNDSIFYSTWEDYLENLIIHNYFFPTTKYELVGFSIKDDSFKAVVKQPFVKETEKTDLQFVKQFMADNGFTNTKNNDYYNPELGIILEDLHDENVLTRDGIPYFIDTVFYYKPVEAKQEVQPAKEPEPLKLSEIPAIVKAFMPPMQQKAIVGTTELFDVVKELEDRINKMPHTYQTENIDTDDKIIYLHYFYGESDWYIVEKDKGSKDDPRPNMQTQAFGYTVAHGDYEMAEWGYINIEELKATNKVELDFYWTPKKFSELDFNRKAIFDEIINTNYRNQYDLNKAIERFVSLKDEYQSTYTAKDIQFIQRYSGYGGLGKYMRDIEGEENLKGLLFEYYTPDELVKKCWGLAYKYGFKSGKVLEPSCAVGRFIKYAPDKSLVKGYEINNFSAKIAKITYPKADIVLNYFESEFYTGFGKRQMNKKYVGTFDLVIGNAPFGDYGGHFSSMGEKEYSKAKQIDHHFLVRSLDACKPGGLVVMIVSSRFMQGNHYEVKQKIMERGELLDAYRLPGGLFQNTEVSADILVLRKK